MTRTPVVEAREDALRAMFALAKPVIGTSCPASARRPAVSRPGHPTVSRRGAGRLAEIGSDAVRNIRRLDVERQ